MAENEAGTDWGDGAESVAILVAPILNVKLYGDFSFALFETWEMLWRVGLGGKALKQVETRE